MWHIKAHRLFRETGWDMLPGDVREYEVTGNNGRSSCAFLSIWRPHYWRRRAKRHPGPGIRTPLLMCFLAETAWLLKPRFGVCRAGVRDPLKRGCRGWVRHSSRSLLKRLTKLSKRRSTAPAILCSPKDEVQS
jgi:hypothetical protein